jgi:hypothetical protein
MAMIHISVISMGLRVLARGFAWSTGTRSGIAQNAGHPISSVHMEERSRNAVIVRKMVLVVFLSVSTTGRNQFARNARKMEQGVLLSVSITETDHFARDARKMVQGVLLSVITAGINQFARNARKMVQGVLLSVSITEPERFARTARTMVQEVLQSALTTTGEADVVSVCRMAMEEHDSVSMRTIDQGVANAG